MTHYFTCCSSRPYNNYICTNCSSAFHKSCLPRFKNKITYLKGPFINCCDENIRKEDEHSLLEATVSDLLDDSFAKDKHITKLKNDHEFFMTEACRNEEKLNAIIKEKEEMISDLLEQLDKQKTLSQKLKLTTKSTQTISIQTNNETTQTDFARDTPDAPVEKVAISTQTETESTDTLARKQYNQTVINRSGTLKTKNKITINKKSRKSCNKIQTNTKQKKQKKSKPKPTNTLLSDTDSDTNCRNELLTIDFDLGDRLRINSLNSISKPAISSTSSTNAATKLQLQTEVEEDHLLERLQKIRKPNATFHTTMNRKQHVPKKPKLLIVSGNGSKLLTKQIVHSFHERDSLILSKPGALFKELWKTAIDNSKNFTKEDLVLVIPNFHLDTVFPLFNTCNSVANTNLIIINIPYHKNNNRLNEDIYYLNRLICNFSQLNNNVHMFDTNSYLDYAGYVNKSSSLSFNSRSKICDNLLKYCSKNFIIVDPVNKCP